MGGIPVPYANCSIYRIEDNDEEDIHLEEAGFDIRVYNIFSIDIPAGSWIPVARTKFGAWVVTGLEGDGGGIGITVEEVDGSPSYTGITTMRVDQADGLTVTNPAAGVARIDFTWQGLPVGAADFNPLYTNQTGLVFDEADGFVITSSGSPGTARVDLAFEVGTSGDDFNISGKTFNLPDAAGGSPGEVRGAVSAPFPVTDATEQVFQGCKSIFGTFRVYTPSYGVGTSPTLLNHLVVFAGANTTSVEHVQPLADNLRTGFMLGAGIFVAGFWLYCLQDNGYINCSYNITTATGTGTGRTVTLDEDFFADGGSAEVVGGVVVDWTPGTPDPPSDEQEISVTGNGFTIVDGDATPSAADDTDFGNVAVGEYVEHVFTIINLGLVDDLTLDGTPIVEFTGAGAGDFSLEVDPTTPVPAGDFTTFTVRYTPSVAGSSGGVTMTIQNNDTDEDPWTCTIQGTGTEPEMNVQGNSVSIVDGDTTPSAGDHTDFGSVDVTSGTQDRTFTIQNLGTAALNLTGTPKVAVSGTHAADFTVTVQPTSPVAASGSTTFTVRFDPSASGTRSATLSIANDDASENPYNFDIQGTGTTPAPEMVVEGNSIEIADGDTTPTTADDTDFTNCVIGESIGVFVFTIRNTGAANLTLTGTPKVAISGPGAAYLVCGAQPTSPVTPSGTSDFAMSFNPFDAGAVGEQIATVSIANDDSDENPYTFNVRGFGFDAALNLAGFWKFDTSPGLLVDSSGNGNDLTNVDTVTSGTGILDQCAVFDGGTQHLKIASNATIEYSNVSLTWAIWLKPTATAGMYAVSKCDFTASSTTGLAIATDGDLKIDFHCHGITNTLKSDDALTLNAWNLVICWYDQGGQTIHIKINNGTTKSVAMTDTVVSTSNDLMFGSDPNAGAEWTGSQDQARFFKSRVLNAAELAALWNGGVGL